jgi:hypothetical protein
MDHAFRFTSTGATQDLVVLDVRIVVTDRLITKNYQKPTDKRTLLNAESDHPEHVKRSIAYGVALRMRRLCSEDSDFKQALIDQGWALLCRGHKPEWIKKGFARALLRSREETLQDKPKKDSTKKQVRFITYFDAKTEPKKVFRKLKSEKEALERTEFGTHLKSVELQLVYRNHLNLRRRLVNKEPEKKEDGQKEVGFTKCAPTKKCKFCKSVKGDAVVKSFPSIFQLGDLQVPKSNCETENVVYFCGCLTCGESYVGQTGGKLKVRCLRHILGEDDVRKKLSSGRDKEWSEPRWHFAEKEHRDAFFCVPLRVLRPDTSQRNREKIENAFIKKLKPSLNVKGSQDASRRRRSGSGSPAHSPAPSLRRRLADSRRPTAAVQNPSQPTDPQRGRLGSLPSRLS